MSWGAVGKDEPVKGDPVEFGRVADRWAVASEHARVLSATFGGIVADTRSIGFQGQAAEAFQSIIEESQFVLDDVPVVCSDLSTVMANHARRLQELRDEANSALARATTAWNERAKADQQSDAARSRAERIGRQIASLRLYPPEQVGQQMQTLEYNLDVEQRNMRFHGSQSHAADSRLQVELRNRDAYSRREISLNTATAAALNCIDLRTLRDPGGLFGLLGELASEFGDGFDVFWATIKPFVEQALIALRDVIDVVLDVLAFASLVMMFIPGLQLVGLIVAGVALGLAAIKLASTVALVGMGTTDPKNGQPFNWGDVGVDAIGVGVAALGFVGAGAVYKAGAAGVKATSMTVRVAKVADTKKAQVALMAAGNAPGVVEDIAQGEFGLKSISEVRGAIFTSPPLMMIDTIISPDRRLSAPCSCQLAPLPVGAR